MTRVKKDDQFTMSCTKQQREAIKVFKEKYNKQHGTSYTQSEVMLLAFIDFVKRSKIPMELKQKELFPREFKQKTLF